MLDGIAGTAARCQQTWVLLRGYRHRYRPLQRSADVAVAGVGAAAAASVVFGRPSSRWPSLKPSNVPSRLTRTLIYADSRPELFYVR